MKSEKQRWLARALIHTTLLLLVTVTTFQPDSLVAQERPDSIRPDTVFTVGGLVVTALRRTTVAGGASGIIAFPESLAIEPVATFEDALRKLPFVLVRQNSRGMAEISVRGSESRQVAVLLDGVPLTLAWDHRTDPAVIPLMGVRDLTLVRGLPSVLSGPNVLGGVVEVDLGRGGFRDDRDDLRASVSVDNVGYRAVGASGVQVSDLSSGHLVFRAGAGFRSRDGFALPSAVVDPSSEENLRTNSDVEEVNGFGAIRWESYRGSWISLSTSGFRAERGVPPELHVQEPRLWRYPNEWHAVAALSAGTGQRSTPWGMGDLEASVGFNGGRQDIEAFGSLDYDEVVETESGDDRNLTLRLLGEHTLTSRGQLRAALSYADVNHTETLDEVERNEYRQRLWSLASETAWNLPKTTQLTVGVALDGADTPESGGKPPLGRLWAWGGRVGVSTLMLNQDVQLHASVSTRARFPALRELYSGALGRFEPNPDLDPERLNAAELGATFKRSGIEVQAALFRHELRDAVVRTSTPEGQYRRINRDMINSTGIELLLGGSYAGAEIQGDIMLQHVTVEDPAATSGPTRPEHMPEFTAGLDLHASLPLGFRGLAGLKHTGDQYCVHPELDTDVALDGKTRIDLGLRRDWQVGQGLWSDIRTTLSLDNLADVAVFDQCGMPQPGRTVRLGIEVF